MRRSSLPNLKDNIVVSRSNVGFSHSPSVSRSWSPRALRRRPENHLTRSLGDRGQERKVLEWCKKNNVNVIRKLPKLDSTILTSRGVKSEKFMTFVDEAKMVEREPAAKPPDYSKERTPSAEHRTKFCQFCQREKPKKKRRSATFFTSPYECEYCGASNEIYDDSSDDVSSSDSDDDPTPVERVRDTIRHGNPAQVIDHRTFPENSEKSENLSGKVVDTENDESDIFWRTESDTTDFDSFQGNLSEKMDDLYLSDVNETSSSNTVFITETSGNNHGNRPVEIKMAWDDDSNNQLAEISRTIATNDGIEEDNIISQKSCSRTSESYSEKPETYSENLETCNSNMSLSPENDSMQMDRLSPTPPSGNRPKRARSPRYGDNRKGLGLEVSPVEAGNNANETNAMVQSPIANRSVGLSRLALMRMTRESRKRSRTSQSSPGTPQTAHKILEPRSHSQDSYLFLDEVSPEIKSFHERQNRPSPPDP